jgi:hypothetical protein
MKEQPNGPDMIGELFGERQRFTDETTTTLAKSIIEALNMTGFASLFADSLMAFGGQNAGIGLQEIGVADARWR